MEEKKRKLEISALAFRKNFEDFKKDVIRMKKNNISSLHYDVMDNIFVPNTSFINLDFLDYLISNDFEISVHLMVKDVEYYLKKIVYKKVKYITFHCESQNVEKGIELIRFIRSKNILAGVAIKPKTNINDYERLIKMSDIITVMSVEPGFGGQKYIEGSEKRVNLIKQINKDALIQIDGGINNLTINLVKDNCDLIVSGSYLYDNANNYQALEKLINQKGH